MEPNSIRKARFRQAVSTISRPTRVAWVSLSMLLASIFVGEFFPASKLFATEPGWRAAKIPTKPADIQDFTATVEVLNPVSEGYLPLRITATSVIGSFPGDRPIRINVVPKFGAQPKPNTTYTASLMLTAGNTSVTQEFYLPKYFEGGNFNVVLGDANGPLESYVASFNVGVSNGIKGPEMLLSVSDWLTRTAIILPDSNTVSDQPWARVPDLRSLESMVSVDPSFVRNYQRQTDDEALTYLQVQSHLSTQLLRADEAHESWLGYESVDVILVALPTLESMKQNHPERFKAVRDWVSCGGVIWTYAVPDTGTLAEVFDVVADDTSRAVSTVASASVSRADTTDPLLRATYRFTPAMRATKQQFINEPYGYSGGMGPSQMRLNDPAIQFERAGTEKTGMFKPPEPNATHPFLVTKSVNEYGDEIDRLNVEAGVVVGLTVADPFPGSLEQWFIVKDLSGANQVWRHRRGISIMRGSNQFWDWLMNNVARPPVYAFLALLSGFVLLVGPISYHFTRRANRGYLMFLIAPVLAAITTLLLFGYGFIADGFGTKTRVRQITWVDGESGRATEMNRATYFAAFRPSSGLRFPIDSAVYPVQNTDDVIEADYSNNLRFDRSIELTDSEQIFRGEYLPSRTQSQFLSYRPLDQPGGLTVSYSAGQWNLVSQFKASLLSAILRMPDRTYCMLEGSLEPGQSVALSPVSNADAKVAMREMYRSDQPQTPLGYTPGGRRSRNWYQLTSAISVLSNLPASWADTNDDLGIYEAKLRNLLADENKLPVAWFVGKLEMRDDASAVPGAKILESVHYVMGSMSLKGTIPTTPPNNLLPEADEDLEVDEDDANAVSEENTIIQESQL